MLFGKPIPAAMAIVIIVSAGGAALAEADGKSDDAKKIEVLLSAKVTAAQAIAAAEQKTGGRAFKVGVEDENDRAVYEVKTITKDKVVEVFIDPVTGQAIRTKDEGLVDRMFDREDDAQLAKLAQSPTTLIAAIAAAEQQTGGKAVEASYDDEDGSDIVELEVMKNNVRHDVKVDGATGKVLNVSPGEGDNNHEH